MQERQNPQIISKKYTREILEEPQIPLSPLPDQVSRARFAEFLRNMPPFGLGLHATTTFFAESIKTHGLDAKYSDPRTNGVYFVVLPPQRDLNLTNPEDLKSIDGTYMRLKRTIAGITRSFGYAFALGVNEAYKTDEYKAMLVVFTHAERLLFDFTGPTIKDYILHSLKGIPLGPKEKRVRFKLPRDHYEVLGKARYLPEVSPEFLLPESYILDDIKQLTYFSEQTVNFLVNKYSPYTRI